MKEESELPAAFGTPEVPLAKPLATMVYCRILLCWQVSGRDASFHLEKRRSANMATPVSLYHQEQPGVCLHWSTHVYAGCIETVVRKDHDVASSKKSEQVHASAVSTTLNVPVNAH